MATTKIITNPDLKTVTHQVLEAGFAEFEEVKVTVGINSPESPQVLPFVSVHLLGDAESDSHIGDALADQLLDDQVYAGIGAEFTQQVQVKLWSNKATERDRLGPLLKAILLAGRGTDAKPGLYLTTDGLEVPKIGGGYDEDIEVTAEQYSPQMLHMRTYILTAKATLTVQEPVGAPVETILVRGDDVDIDAELFANDALTASYAGGP